MTRALRVFLDEGVPDLVAKCFEDSGYEAIRHRQVLSSGSKDDLVCLAALKNEAILVVQDGDVKEYARRYNAKVKDDRFKDLSIIRICCRERRAVERISQALSLIELEWAYACKSKARRLWLEVHENFIKTCR